MNDSDAFRLQKMAVLINHKDAREYLDLAYKLGHVQGMFDGIEQARQIMREEREKAA